MRLLGAEVRRRRRRQPHAEGRHQRGDARLGRPTSRDTYYLLGSVLGPHPYPLMVREFQSVIGREARAQILAQAGRLPDAVVACVGGGSNAIGHLRRVHRRRRRAADRRRGRRRARSRRGRHAARFAGGSAGRAAGHADLRAAGRGRQHRADALDLGRPRLRGRRPGARVAARARPRRVRATSTDDEALDAFQTLARLEGHPAGARVGARHRVRAAAGAGRSGRDAIAAGEPVGPRRQGRADAWRRRCVRRRRCGHELATRRHVRAAARGAAPGPRDLHDGRRSGPARGRPRSCRRSTARAPTCSRSACRSPIRWPTAR